MDDYDFDYLHELWDKYNLKSFNVYYSPHHDY
jgi:hypothetical protein